MTALAGPHLSLLQVVMGIVVLAWIALVGFGVALVDVGKANDVGPAAPSEPDELDGLFEDWPTREDTR
jgi:hypothetical protein